MIYYELCYGKKKILVTDSDCIQVGKNSPNSEDGSPKEALTFRELSESCFSLAMLSMKSTARINCGNPSKCLRLIHGNQTLGEKQPMGRQVTPSPNGDDLTAKGFFYSL